MVELLEDSYRTSPTEVQILSNSEAVWKWNEHEHRWILATASPLFLKQRLLSGVKYERHVIKYIFVSVKSVRVWQCKNNLVPR